MEATELQNLHHRSSMHALPCVNASRATHNSQEHIYTRTHPREHIVHALIRGRIVHLHLFCFSISICSLHKPGLAQRTITFIEVNVLFSLLRSKFFLGIHGARTLWVTCTEPAIACTYQEPAMHSHVMPVKRGYRSQETEQSKVQRGRNNDFTFIDSVMWLLHVKCFFFHSL
jgi:hypothetical protein